MAEENKLYILQHFTTNCYHSERNGENLTPKKKLFAKPKKSFRSKKRVLHKNKEQIAPIRATTNLARQIKRKILK